MAFLSLSSAFRLYFASAFGLAEICCFIAFPVAVAQPVPFTDEVTVLKFSFARQSIKPQASQDARTQESATRERRFLDVNVTESKASETTPQQDQQQDYFLIELHRSWAPVSYERFLALVRAGFFEEQRFVRAVPGFILDWNYAPTAGLDDNDDPLVRFYKDQLSWYAPNASDRQAGGRFQTNSLGTVAFGQEADGRTKSEVFVNLAANARLDRLGFWPVGRLLDLSSRSVAAQVQQWQSGQINFDHGDVFFAGNASSEEASRRQKKLMNGGNKFIDERYPGCTYITKVDILSVSADALSADEEQ
eukprot:TRINITY_DN74862_c0_g1_i1.p1 TRINITY_DN74862_c0_g1~~TRINITY_DN74862_c0_g1_i1.p1  ORF type:complete len:305 (-),score=38.88 TRINITY_DN74862_c0_g1_i1:576-1490(-)